MKFVKKFEKFIKEAATTKEAPVKPGIDVPVKPKQPTKPVDPDEIEKPSVNPDPKAEKENVTEMDVINRFREELEKTGEPVEKYINK